MYIMTLLKKTDDLYKQIMKLKKRLVCTCEERDYCNLSLLNMERYRLYVKIRLRKNRMLIIFVGIRSIEIKEEMYNYYPPGENESCEFIMDHIWKLNYANNHSKMIKSSVKKLLERLDIK